MKIKIKLGREDIKDWDVLVDKNKRTVKTFDPVCLYDPSVNVNDLENVQQYPADMYAYRVNSKLLP